MKRFVIYNAMINVNSVMRVINRTVDFLHDHVGVFSFPAPGNRFFKADDLFV